MKTSENGFIKRYWNKYYRRLSFRQIIWFYFTSIALIATLFIGISFYGRFSAEVQRTIKEENQKLIEQVANNCGTYIRNMMKVSDSLYYSSIKKTDLTEGSLSESFQLIYDTNKDNIESIALFSLAGELLQATPAATIKPDIEIRGQEWFSTALENRENMHFSQPIVSNIFSTEDTEYTWVMPLSRSVQVTIDGSVKTGVLLINLRYSALEELFGNILLGNNSYVYLADSSGDIIYHPMQQLVFTGDIEENNFIVATQKDGIYSEDFNGEGRDYAVKSLGYTGWKVVGVIPQGNITLSTFKSNLFIVFLTLFFLMSLALIYSYVSKRVSDPILRLEQAVKKLEEGDWDTDVTVSGFAEVQHLGRAIQNMADHIKELMEDIVNEHEAKRRSDLQVLQNQINPHFLYNTLDIIVWMVENEKQAEAVKAVTALARFFRISLSKGKNIINVKDEVEHVRNYLTIQEMRYKNRFSYSFEVSEETCGLGTIKLVLQPLVENAIYHAMEFMDGDGKIQIKAWKEDDMLKYSVSDNGCGMTEEIVWKILSRAEFSQRKGSGVGVRNVIERIKLLFGDEYGISIESEPDKGTTITVIMPAIPYDVLCKEV